MPLLPLIYHIPATVAFFLPLKHKTLFLASVPLHRLFSVAGMLFGLILPVSDLSSCHCLREA